MESGGDGIQGLGGWELREGEVMTGASLTSETADAASLSWILLSRHVDDKNVRVVRAPDGHGQPMTGSSQAKPQSTVGITSDLHYPKHSTRRLRSGGQACVVLT